MPTLPIGQNEKTTHRNKEGKLSVADARYLVSVQ